MIDYMRYHGIKEKDIYNVGSGLDLIQMNRGDFPVTYGEKDFDNRKTFVLVQGKISILTPVHPQTMLKKITDVLDDRKKTFASPRNIGDNFESIMIGKSISAERIDEENESDYMDEDTNQKH